MNTRDFSLALAVGAAALGDIRSMGCVVQLVILAIGAWNAKDTGKRKVANVRKFDRTH